MRIAEVPNGKRKNSPDIRIWNGLNRSQGAADGEVIDCVGLSTKMWPAMSAADGRTRIGEWENATDVYETDGHLIVIDDNKLYYDGKELRAMTPGQKQFAEINRKLVIWPDKIYINLNTGEVGGLEASVSGNVSMSTTDNGILTITASAGTGSLTLNNAYFYDQSLGVGANAYGENYWFRFYKNLGYSNGWFYDEKENRLPTLYGEKGESKELGGNYAYFIAKKNSSGKYVPQYTSFETDESSWSMEGTIYGKLTKMTITAKTSGQQEIDGYLYDYETYSARYDFELYNAAVDGLETFFETGDTVSIEGSTLAYNNKEAVEVLGAEGNSLVIAEDALVKNAYYYDVTQDYAIGTYGLITSGTVLRAAFTTTRKLLRGEQVFCVPTDGDGGLSKGVVYSFNPVTGVLSSFETVSTTTYTKLTGYEYAATTAEAITIARKVPNMDYICEKDNRLYGVSNSEEEKIFNTQTGQYETVTSRVLHASALGQPTRWNVFEGAATDSYAVAVAGEGDFTGIVSYSGSVIAFKEDRMYKLTGDYPAEFYLRSYSVDGVKKNCQKSLVIINEVLYYLSPYGVMSYSGGVPGLISYNLDLLRFQDAVAGRDRTRYYISMEDPENGYMIYSYDTVRDIWVIERKEQATGIERVGDYAYACIDGKIYKLADELSQEETTWMALLPETDEGIFEKKRYQNARLIADVDGSLTVSCRQNDHEEWQTLGTITEKGKKVHSLPMDTIRCDRIQFKLEGEGKATIWAFERQFTVGSER